MRTAHIVPAVVLALCGTTLAQYEGHFITTVSHAGKGRMFDVDPSQRKSTEFTLPASIMNDSVNTITMFTPTLGWVGTIGTAQTASAAGVPSDLYRIAVDWNAHKITATKLNSNKLGGYNLAQITRVGSTLYFVTSDFSLSGTAGNANGILYSMPMGGGAATQLLKIGLKIREREVTRLPVDQTGAAMFQPLCLLVGAERFRVISRPITKQHLRKTLVGKTPALLS